MKRYLPFFTLFSFVAVVISFYLYRTHGYVALYTDFTAASFFFIFSSPVLYYISIKGVKMKNNYSFMNYFYLSFAIKFFLAILFVLVYLLYTGHKGWVFAGTFAVCYVLFSALETACTVMEANAYQAQEGPKKSA